MQFVKLRNVLSCQNNKAHFQSQNLGHWQAGGQLCKALHWNPFSGSSRYDTRHDACSTASGLGACSPNSLTWKSRTAHPKLDAFWQSPTRISCVPAGRPMPAWHPPAPQPGSPAGRHTRSGHPPGCSPWWPRRDDKPRCQGPHASGPFGLFGS